MYLEVDEQGYPIILRLGCREGRPDFSFEWYPHSGADLIVIEVGEGDGDRKNFSFRRDQDQPQIYHVADDIALFMERYLTFKNPSFLAHFANSSRLWTFDVSQTREAWTRVSGACRP